MTTGNGDPSGTLKDLKTEWTQIRRQLVEAMNTGDRLIRRLESYEASVARDDGLIRGLQAQVRGLEKQLTDDLSLPPLQRKLAGLKRIDSRKQYREFSELHARLLGDPELDLETIVCNNELWWCSAPQVWEKGRGLLDDYQDPLEIRRLITQTERGGLLADAAFFRLVDLQVEDEELLLQVLEALAGELGPKERIPDFLNHPLVSSLSIPCISRLLKVRGLAKPLSKYLIGRLRDLEGEAFEVLSCVLIKETTVPINFRREAARAFLDSGNEGTLALARIVSSIAPLRREALERLLAKNVPPWHLALPAVITHDRVTINKLQERLVSICPSKALLLRTAEESDEFTDIQMGRLRNLLPIIFFGVET